MARTRVDVIRDVQYGEAGGQKLLLDVYVPWGPSMDRPAILFIHGGSWMGGDKGDYHSFALKMASRGYVGFAVNYRLANKWGNKWPAQIDDVQRAVRWVRAHARQYGVDPDRVGAIGESAGGHLVAMLGVTDTWNNSDPALAGYSSRVNCVVDLFGPTDFWLTPADKETKGAR
ncbi:MAG: alpha/beta hydrolase, partial [Chloroflexi bacterium]|nr:alpha/beta hydrolase [Chloroflexota bacterium]